MYPIAYSAAYEGEDRNRLTVFFRLIVAIPWFLVLAIYGIGAFFAVIFAWFSLVFTGRYPDGLYAFNAGVLRMSARVSGFYSLLTDRYPSFGLGEDPDYPIRALVGPPKEEYSRAKALFRIILIIPVHILAWVMGVIIEVIGLIAWFVILFTGELPADLYRLMRNASSYTLKAGAYGMLLTEDYPPIWQEEDEEAPRFERPAVS